ncbi:potassium channel family protein [Thermodesulforhabdus norvegica]|uniref:Voltage-gated potassium channel n=1 Tax=Thermodesulforhabdus norvegica TaxID=39841 RepID=A0A1I4RF15_9BACT|nr:potassium channel protein [Thermodesulforhabdus norvegica]SFM50851.1 voltage-gated potassium channel [Thermodesulforhabdus norvegica]
MAEYIPKSVKNRLIFATLATLSIILFGTIGYISLEGFTFLEALYMTVITLTTIGFSEVRPLDEAGRIFTIILIFVGMAFVLSQVAYIGEFLLDGQFVQLYRRRRVKRKLDEMHDHYIICGYGQMGKIVVDELVQRKVPVVVIEQSEDEAVKLAEKNIPYLIGDATEEEILIMAGVKRAKGLVAVVARDTDNVFIVLTARDLNRDLFICARAGTAGAEKRLLKAGANRVVSPYVSGARRIASNILRPTVTDFLELALSGEGMELSMEEITLVPGCRLIGKDLIESQIRSTYNLIIVAIKRSSGVMIYNPSPKEVLQEGDILVAIGPRNNLEKFALDVSGGASTAGICSCGHVKLGE